MTYAEQLKHPAWQRKRLEIMQAADFRCEECGMNEHELGALRIQLTVHHLYYVRGMRLWEYPRALLMCVCSACHLERQQVEEEIYVNVASVMRDKSVKELRDLPIYAFFKDAEGRRVIA